MITKIFDSLGDLSRYIKSTPRTKHNEAFSIKDSEAESTSDTKFTGTASFAAADELLLKGYEAGVAALQNATKKVSRNYKVVTTIKNDVCGFVPNVGAYLTGNPRNMMNITTRRVNSKSKVLNLVICVTVHGGVSSDTIIEVNGKILRNVIELERSGYNVNLYVVDLTTYKKHDSTCIMVKIKSSNERLNPLKVSYPLVHPSFLRRHIFAVQERLSDIEGTYGRYMDMSSAELEEYTGLKNVVFIKTKDYVRRQNESYDMIRSDIDKQLK